MTEGGVLGPSLAELLGAPDGAPLFLNLPAGELVMKPDEWNENRRGKWPGTLARKTRGAPPRGQYAVDTAPIHAGGPPIPHRFHPRQRTNPRSSSALPKGR